MPTRNKAEKERSEKRIRAERIVIPAVFVAAVAAFIVIGAAFGKTAKPSDSSAAPTEKVSVPTDTPAPTEAPYSAVIRILAASFRGEISDGSNFSSLSYKSSADGSSPVVTAYLKSGVLSMQIVRSMEQFKIESSPEATEDMFSGIGIGNTDAPDNTSAVSENKYSQIAEELFACISAVHDPEDPSDVKAAIEGRLTSLAAGTVKKAEMVFGVYIVEFKYSSSDGVLTVVCEPAK